MLSSTTNWNNASVFGFHPTPEEEEEVEEEKNKNFLDRSAARHVLSFRTMDLLAKNTDISFLTEANWNVVKIVLFSRSIDVHQK